MSLPCQTLNGIRTLNGHGIVKYIQMHDIAPALIVVISREYNNKLTESMTNNPLVDKEDVEV